MRTAARRSAMARRFSTRFSSTYSSMSLMTGSRNVLTSLDTRLPATEALSPCVSSSSSRSARQYWKKRSTKAGESNTGSVNRPVTDARRWCRATGRGGKPAPPPAPPVAPSPRLRRRSPLPDPSLPSEPSSSRLLPLRPLRVLRLPLPPSSLPDSRSRRAARRRLRRSADVSSLKRTLRDPRSPSPVSLSRPLPASRLELRVGGGGVLTSSPSLPDDDDDGDFGREAPASCSSPLRTGRDTNRRMLSPTFVILPFTPRRAARASRCFSSATLVASRSSRAARRAARS
mmetsp:Transcript_22197/g.77815  ORF Transcript_22197/g.77815 Transcript_22197/m.77815 type:complete len:287 (+) Transcript_22197:181-1041(+)